MQYDSVKVTYPVVTADYAVGPLSKVYDYWRRGSLNALGKATQMHTISHH